jgi:hypothetical protein
MVYPHRKQSNNKVRYSDYLLPVPLGIPTVTTKILDIAFTLSLIK